jgi:hypothetical protein
MYSLEQGTVPTIEVFHDVSSRGNQPPINVSEAVLVTYTLNGSPSDPVARRIVVRSRARIGTPYFDRALVETEHCLFFTLSVGSQRIVGSALRDPLSKYGLIVYVI